MKSKHLGMGVVLCEDVLKIDEDLINEYSQWLKKNEEENFTYYEENGVKYARNKTGFKFKLDEINVAPQRFLDLKGELSESSPKNEWVDFIQKCENAVYNALVEYCKYFPDAATTAWWRPRGHIAAYEDGQRIGPHCDDQIPFDWNTKPKNQVSIHNSTSINLYLNNSEKDYKGGEINFPLIPYIHSPKSGDVIMYPSNYIGRHEVLPVTSGKRLAFLTIACYGVDLENKEELIDINNDYKFWMPDLINDSSL
jgi:predicted 2-oxoglutarate/Fe(II)-dependent dioxygenase YbiX